MAVGKPNPVGKMTGANDGVADGIITHAVNLERLKSSEVQAVWAMLRKVQGDIIEQLNALDPTAVGGKTRIKRLERLLNNTKATIRANYALIQKNHSGTLTTIADLEGKAIQQAVGAGVGGEPKIGVALLNSLPPTPVLRALVNNTLIMGAPHKEHWARQAGDLQQRFQDQMREGILAGEGVDNLVRRVRGTKAGNFKDGIMEVKRYQAAALVRTSVQAVSNAARQTVIEANADIFNGVQWLSTLDSRTSDICKARSGLRWDNDFNPIGHSKQWSAPPAHWNCRSVVTPITKSFSELAGKKVAMKSGELTENFKNELGKLGFTAVQIKGIRRNMQSSMDGAVPAEFTYEDWIRRKPEEFQKQVLGDARWRLWNSGKIGFVDLVDQRSNPLSLDQLQELIDKGRTSIARAAKQASKQSAEQAAQEAAALAKKELEAETLLALYAEGGKGFVNYQKALTKLQKKGDLNGKSFQEKVAMVQAAKDAAHSQAIIAKIKKKFGDGAKLSPSELALYKTLDADVKGEIRILAQAKGLQKEIDDELAAYNKAVNEKPLLVTSYGLDTPNKLTNLTGSPQQKLAQVQVAKQKLSDAVDAELETFKDIKPFILDSEFGGKEGSVKAIAVKKLIGDFNGTKDFLEKVPGATNKEKLAALTKAQDEAIADEVAKQTAAQDILFKYEGAQKGGGLLAYKKMLNQLEKSGDLENLTPVQMVAKVDEQTKAVLAKAQFDKHKSNVSAALAEGKTLTPANQKWYDSLDASDKETVDAIVAKKQAKAGLGPSVPKAPPATPDNQPTLVFSDFEQVGGQGGSNLGGEFINNRTGTRYYVKAPESELAARVEVLSAKLYKMAGVRAADIDLMPITGDIGGVSAVGRLGIASRMETVLDLDTGKMGKVSGAKDGFVADAWLANWDVIGNGSPKQLNLKQLADGTALRIDTGGTLFFRAQGGRKAFDANDVPELDSLRDSGLAANASRVFGDISEDQIVAGVARIVAIADDDIRRIVRETMGEDADDLAEVLIGRKNFLAAKYEKQLAAITKPAKPPASKVITKTEERNIKDSGMNGYSIATDKDQIEDQLVHLYEYTDVDNAVRSGVYLKVRGEAADKLKAAASKADQAANSVSVSDLDDNFITAIKGIAMRASKSEALEAKDFQRIQLAEKSYQKTRSEIIDLEANGKVLQGTVDKFDEKYAKWRNALIKINNTQDIGDQAQWGVSGKFSGVGDIEIVEAKKKTTGIKWSQKRNATWSARRFEDGKGFDQSGADGYTHRGTVYTTEVDGVEVRFWDDNADAALRNRLELSTKGGGAVAAETQLSVLKKLGVDTTRATAADREQLYLAKTLYAQAAQQGRRTTWYTTRMKKASGIGSQEKRLEYLRKEASTAMGVDDITALPSYRPLGDWQQYGHGRIIHTRPDLNGPEWQQFQKDYVLYHNLYSGVNVESIKNIVEGGGHMAPTMDKLRRGIIPRGMSPGADIESGGAQYFFTRLRKSRRSKSNAGLVWRGQQAGRLDAISYDGDKFGKTNSEQYVLSNRKTTIEGMKSAAEYGSNETIFKDSLSIFDDLLYIVAAGEKSRLEIIAYLKTKMKKWPDGRKLEDVVVESD